ncbi:response regulator [bacterium]|nr:response regulator [bacterium]
MKIMVVDDELVSRKKMEKILSSFGKVEGVENGEKAIIVFRMALDMGEGFDLITMDIEMPKLDGTEALLEIRELEKRKKVPKDKQVKVLMVTAYSQKECVIACIQAGCNDYVVKPFTRETVIKKLFDLDIPIPV